MSDIGPVDEWLIRVDSLAIHFAEASAKLGRERPDGAGPPVLESLIVTAVSWWIDQGFSKQQIVSALRAGVTSPELKFEGWLSQMDPDA